VHFVYNAGKRKRGKEGRGREIHVVPVEGGEKEKKEKLPRVVVKLAMGQLRDRTCYRLLLPSIRPNRKERKKDPTTLTAAHLYRMKTEGLEHF